SMRVPGERYTASTRPYRGLPDLAYPFHDWSATVTHCGRLCFDRRKVNISQVFAGQQVGVRQVTDRIWLVSFMDYDLGYFDDETCRLREVTSQFTSQYVAPRRSGDLDERTGVLGCNQQERPGRTRWC